MMLSFVLIFAVALIPVALLGCAQKNTEAQKMNEALSASIETIKNYNKAESVSATGLVEVDESLDDNLFLLDYTNEILKSKNYEYQNVPIKVEINVSDGENQMTMLGLHSCTIDGNNIKIELLYSVEGMPETTDYELMNINYDFDKDELISFEWTSYIGEISEEGSVAMYCEYKDSLLKRLEIDDSEEYTSFKNEAKTKAESFYNTEELSEKTYNFTNEYVKIFNIYDSEIEIQPVEL